MPLVLLLSLLGSAASAITDTPICADEMPPRIQEVLRHACGTEAARTGGGARQAYCSHVSAEAEDPCRCQEFVPERLRFGTWWRLLNNGTHTNTLGRMRQMSRLVRKLQPGTTDRATNPPLTVFGFNSGYAYLFENWAVRAASATPANSRARARAPPNPSPTSPPDSWAARRMASRCATAPS